ncbi:MAG: hypothetical protein RIG84_06795 [Roseovarius sp.]
MTRFAFRPIALAAGLCMAANLATAENAGWSGGGENRAYIGQGVQTYAGGENATYGITRQGTGANLAQPYSAENSAYVGQSGQRNTAALHQSGRGNNAVILQPGNNNQAYLRQRGGNKNAVIVQAGDGTVVRIKQRGKKPGGVIVWAW